MRKHLAFVAFLLVIPATLRAADEMRAHYINVGQGACTLLEFSCGAVLIDTGGQDDGASDHQASFLAEFFRRRPDLNNTLDLLIISHPHLDHTRGIKDVFKTCRVARYIDNGIVSGSGRAGPKFVRDSVANGDHTTVIREIDDDEIVNLPAVTGLADVVIDPIRCPDCDPEIRVLSGGMTENPGWTDGDFDNLNNHSVVVRVDFGASSFLFTGDLEEPAIETLVEYYADTDLLDVDVYLVGHHGSHNGTTASLVSAMSPDIAVIGVGESSFGRNRKRGFNTFSFGHPRRVVLELLNGAISGRRSRAIDVEVADGARRFSEMRVTKRIYTTAWDGDITIAAKLDGSMRVTSDTSGIPPTLAPAALARTPARATRSVPSAAAPPRSVVSQPFAWNLPIPEKRPPNDGNGKLVLFDASHAETAGQADWVIDGGFSDFADALVGIGFAVKEYRGTDRNSDGVIRFVDDRHADGVFQNEATIEFAAIKDAAVFVMAETNRPLSKDELAALLQFVESGGGLFLISDHYNADRNLDAWDATEVFNGYNRSTASQFDMGGKYGDLRNPGDPSKGWLAENFGIRFRFNAINCKSGVSDIASPDSAEQLTKGVEPILMAAGATLAIVDPSRAKGIVYLDTDDEASSWPSAIEGEEEGLYFGGRDEGPYAAISKPNKGKVAFLGDSSPVEDGTARYLNEQTGSRKRLHEGWKSRGTAATLCLNLVVWLATPEDYVGFTNENGHAPGLATPIAMAPVEQDDPADGQPWRTLPPGYDPWNPDTFAPGSYGGPFPAGGGPGGSDPGSVINLTEALAGAEGVTICVEGIIQNELNDQYGLKLSDSLSSTRFLAVQIPPPLRERFSPKLNPMARGEKVRVTGKRSRYMGLSGMRSISQIDSIAPN